MCASKFRFGLSAVVISMVAITLVLALSVGIMAADVSVDPSGRYYRDANGKPVFLIGYYAWSATADGYYIDQPSRYDSMISSGAPYKVNYIRMILGGNKVDASSNPPSADGRQAPVPWVLVNGKANLSQWDPVYWNAVKAQCQFAKDNGVIIHFDFFDGVSMRDQGGAGYGYNGSFWNPSNQTQSFYPAGYYGDGSGGFYRVNDFNNNTGIGYYQRALIDKACAELAPYDNVFFEVGNELLGQDATWTSAVISYIKTKTSKPITNVGNVGSGLQGFSDHVDDTLDQLKTTLANFVGRGCPAWVDPDGSQIEFLNPDGIRNCYWYAFASGAAAYGGFTCDFWTWPVSPPPGFNTLKGVYAKNLQDFITTTNIPFATMIPQANLVSNSSLNCCLANAGVTYMAYILSDGTATVDLTSVPGNAYYKLYDPKAGTFSAQSTVAGGGVRSFTKPAGASDWVIYVYTTLPSQGQLNVKSASGTTIDGNQNDWNFGNYSSYAYGGGVGAGDIALVGYDNGTLHYGSYTGVLPTNAADHTAKIYAAHDATYEYFLVRCDDDDIRYNNPTSANWQNDCVEFYIDPGNNGGSTAISNSTSDIQLDIDANNQKNVYGTTSGYATQVLNGVTSAVTRDATGWWLEVRLAKNALSPTLPAGGTFGVDFCFRDNDNANDPTKTTVYTWNDPSGAGFPSKIPDMWGDAFQNAPGETPYAGVINLPGTIQAENFDNGGEGVAYHDTEATNFGGAYRPGEGVDLAATTDTGGGYEVGWVNPNEWLNYMVYVNATRAYDLNMRISGGGGNFHINIDGQNVTGSRTTPNTGGWTTYATYTVPSIQLTAGSHVLTVVAETGGFNFNYLDVVVPPVYWNTLGTLHNIGSGQTPCVQVDSAGNIHVAYVAGNGVTYKKYDSAWTLQTSETIASPTGSAYWMNMCLDSNGVPHIVFSESVSPDLPYAAYAFYTNRIGGSWRPVVTAVNLSGSGNSIFNHRIQCYGGYAYLGYQYGYAEVLTGRIDRLTNLSTTPSVDKTVQSTGVRSAIIMTSNGTLWAVGRNGGASTSGQQYDSNLNPVGGLVNWTPGCQKPGAPAALYADKYNVVHMAAWCIQAGGSGGCADRCGMVYNSTATWSPVQGLLGGGSTTGPDGGGTPTGFWNDDVSPAICRDALDVVYVAWRGWTIAGEGRITKVGTSFTQTCTPDAICGGNTCTGTQFAQTLTRRRWQNVELAAPSTGGGVYVAYENGGQCYIQPVGIAAVVDTTPPGNVTNLTDQAEQGMNILRWTNPTDSDLSGVKIMFKTTGYPTGPNDGNQCFNGPGTSYTHTSLTNGVTYYYKAFAHDATPNYASGAQISGTPAIDTTAPGNVTGFTATRGDTQNTLTWANPSDTDLFGVKIIFKTTGYPTGPTDATATQCFSGIAASFTHTGLTNGVTYYYKAYSFDEVPNYPSGAQSSATPYNPQNPYSGVIPIPGIIQAENYDNGGEGFSYHDTTTGNTGGVFRADDVDLEACSDTGGGYDVGWTAAGEWMEYTVNVATTGDYSINSRIAAAGPGTFRIQMDGADIALKSFETTAGWQNWTTIIAPSVPLTAGQHIMRYCQDTSNHNVNYIEFISRGADAVSIDLGNPDAEDGMNNISTGDGDSVPWVIDGHDCKENATTGDNYMYFNVNDTYAYQGSKTDLYITFDYDDIGTGTMALNYDSISDLWKGVAGPTLGNTHKWKSYTFHVSDAYFGNRENYGADFRIAGPGGGAEFAIDTVCVYQGAPDTTPPGPAANFTATPGNGQISLAWTNPTDPDFSGTKIVFKTTGYPTGTTDGTQAYDGSGTSYVHTPLTPGVTYYYKAFAHDGAPNYASGVQASAIPASGPPSDVTGFTATAGNTQVTLAWTNPVSNFTGTKIVFKTGGYPSGPADGTQIYDGAGTIYTHTGLTNGTVYYYKAFAHNAIPSYATGAQAAGIPVGLSTTVRIDFDGARALTASHYTEATGAYAAGLGQGNLGWNLTYSNGNASTMSKDMSWGEVGDGSNGLLKIYDQNPGGNTYMHVNLDVGEVNGDPTGQHMLKWGGLVMARVKNYDSPGSSICGFGYSTLDGNNSGVVCIRNGSVNLKTATGVSSVTAATVSGNQNAWRVYALRWQAGGVCDAWVSNGDSWSSNQTDWTKIFTNITINSPQSAALDQNNNLLSGILMGTYGNSSDTCNQSFDWIDMTANTAPGTTFTVNPWDFNPVAPQDTTPPGNVTGFTATSGDNQITLGWTKPGDADLAGVKIMFKTTGYPTSPTDGTQCYNNNGTSYVHTALTNGVTYYYKAFTYDILSNYASGAQASAIPADVTAPAAATALKAYGLNGQVSLSWTNPTTADFAGVKIMAKTSGYPTSATDGSLVYNGAGTSCTHAGALNGSKYYYSVFAYDEVPNYSTAANATAHAAADATIIAAKGLVDGQVRALRGNTITGAFSGYFYVQDPLQPAGLKVTSTDAVTVGQRVDLVGAMAGSGYERYLDCSGDTVKVTAAGPIATNVVTMGNASAGGVGLNTYAPGMTNGLAPNNVGLQVMVYGKVTQRQTTAPKYFYIDDGAGLNDGTTTGGVANVGLRINGDPAAYAAGSYVAVKGISSCFSSSGLRPQVLPVTITLLKAP